MKIEALDKSPAQEPHELIAFQLLTAADVNRQVCAFVKGR